MNELQYKQILNIIQSMANIGHIRPTDFPNIDLYMDQVTRFMDENLADTKRFEEDKILTKTMINNYAKNKLLPPPEKKRYTKEHMLVLLLIYYLKDFLPLNDIQSILQPVTNQFFANESGCNIDRIYSEIYNMCKAHLGDICQDLLNKLNTAVSFFPDMAGDQAELLQSFSFICMLSFDIYLKKQMIEKVIDNMKKEEK